MFHLTGWSAHGDLVEGLPLREDLSLSLVPMFRWQTIGDAMSSSGAQQIAEKSAFPAPATNSTCTSALWANHTPRYHRKELRMSLFEACQGPALPPVDNIFARIVRKEEPADIVYEDDTVIAFKDIHPVAPCHLLIVPKVGAVRNPNHLTVQHVDLLEHMVAVGKQLLKERAGLTPNQQTAQASMGFHMPPWTIVPHLHMHAIAPLRSLPVWQRLHFLMGSFWYQSAEKILERLKSQQTTQLTL